MTPAPNINGELQRLLADFRGREVVALMNRGNRGDGLIHLGGRQLMRNVGLEVQEMHEIDDFSQVWADVLLVYGSGALSRRTHTLPRLVAEIAPRFSEIVILPASIDLGSSQVRAFARTWDKKYTVFARELVTFDGLKNGRLNARAILLGHDLAFHADLSRWAAMPAAGRAGIFRRDNEAGFGQRPRGLEVCEDASHGTDREPERLLDFVARFEEIHTDRCHGAISAAMMGRRVVLYPNNYYKNAAIYDHSLAGWPNVRFVGRTPFSLRQFGRVLYWNWMRPVEMKFRRLFQGAPSPAAG